MPIINLAKDSPALGLRRVSLFKFNDGNKLGSGLFAGVFRQRGRGGRWLAIKIDSDLISPGEYAGSFLRREAEVLGSLHHPNIVKCLGYGELSSDKKAFLALEYLGGYLRSYKFVKTAADFVAAALLVVEKTSAALAYIHDHGLVHSDLKPDNVMARGEMVKLIDFGFCRPGGRAVTPESKTWVVGGIGYQSLRRWQKLPPIPQDDIYALGIMLYQYLLRPERISPGLSRHSLSAIGDLSVYRQEVYQQGTNEAFAASQKEIGAVISTAELPAGVRLLLERLLGVNNQPPFNNCREIETSIKILKFTD